MPTVDKIKALKETLAIAAILTGILNVILLFSCRCCTSFSMGCPYWAPLSTDSSSPGAHGCRTGPCSSQGL